MCTCALLNPFPVNAGDLVPGPIYAIPTHVPVPHSARPVKKVKIRFVRQTGVNDQSLPSASTYEGVISLSLPLSLLSYISYLFESRHGNCSVAVDNLVSVGNRVSGTRYLCTESYRLGPYTMLCADLTLDSVTLTAVGPLSAKRHFFFTGGLRFTTTRCYIFYTPAVDVRIHPTFHPTSALFSQQQCTFLPGPPENAFVSLLWSHRIPCPESIETAAVFLSMRCH